MKISKRSVITNTIGSTIASVFAQIVSFFIIPLFIEGLGSELYGVWVVSNIIIGYANVLDFGFSDGLQKYVAEARVNKDDKQLSQVVVSGTLALAFVGTVLGIVIFITSPIIVNFFTISEENIGTAIMLLKISALFSIVLWPLRISNVVLKAYMKVKESSFLFALRQSMQSVAMLVLLLTKMPVVDIKIYSTLVFIVFSIPGVVLVRKYVPEINWSIKNFRTQQVRRMSKFSLGMFMFSLLVMLSTKIGSLIVGRMVSMAAVSLLVIVGKPYEIIKTTTSTLMKTLLPVTYNVIPNAKRKERERLVVLAVKYRTLILAPLAAVTIAAIPSFLNLWVGSEYLQYAKWTQLYVAIHFFMGIASLGNVARVAGAMKISNTMLTINVVINIIVSIIATYYVGFGGVILGTVTANILFGEILFGRFICKKIDISYKKVFKTFILPVIVSMIFAGSLLILSSQTIINNWFSLLGLAGLSYMILMTIIFFLFMQEEKEFLFNKFIKRKKIEE